MDVMGHALKNKIKGIKIEVHSDKGVEHIHHGDTGHPGEAMEGKDPKMDDDGDFDNNQDKEKMDLAPSLDGKDEGHDEHGILSKMHDSMSNTKLGSMAKDKMKEKMASIKGKSKSY